jgi:hypothetical protein
MTIFPDGLRNVRAAPKTLGFRTLKQILRNLALALGEFRKGSLPLTHYVESGRKQEGRLSFAAVVFRITAQLITLKLVSLCANVHFPLGALLPREGRRPSFVNGGFMPSRPLELHPATMTAGSDKFYLVARP